VKNNGQQNGKERILRFWKRFLSLEKANFVFQHFGIRKIYLFDHFSTLSLSFISDYKMKLTVPGKLGVRLDL
jgi:hypothetical protein